MSENPTTPSADEPLERLDPSERRDHVATQHWARYEWAATLLPRRRVLDCACGTGYGTALLRARGAAAAVGVDLSPEAIATAQQRYARSGATFQSANAFDLRPETLGRFDLIVSLETIEHVAEPQRLLDVLAALLTPDGVLALSCPNERHLGVQCPYHRWVADLDELRGWLATRFAHVAWFGELHVLGTAIWPQGVVEQRTEPAQLHEAQLRLVDQAPLSRAPGFLLLCSQVALPAPAARGALLLGGFDYVRELQEVCRHQRDELTSLAAGFEQRGAAVRELMARLEEADRQTTRLTDEQQRLMARLSELENKRASAQPPS